VLFGEALCRCAYLPVTLRDRAIGSNGELNHRRWGLGGPSLPGLSPAREVSDDHHDLACCPRPGCAGIYQHRAAGANCRAGITKPVRPHTLRHAFITAALDAGVSLRDVQEAASHADPRTTMRYDRARGSLDQHATYIVAAYVAGAAR
jgi:integrase